MSTITNRTPCHRTDSLSLSFAPAAEVEQRAADIAEFYSTDDPSVARSILSKCGVTWVYAPATLPLKPAVAEILDEVFVKDEVTLYRSREVPKANGS